MIIIAITYEPEKPNVNLQILTPGPHSPLEVSEALAAARWELARQLASAQATPPPQKPDKE